MTRFPSLNARRDVLLFFATIMFALSVRTGAASALLVLAASVLLGAVALTRGREKDEGPRPQDARWSIRILIAVVALGLLGVLGWAPSTFGPTSKMLERVPGVFWVVLAVATFALRRKSSKTFGYGIVFVTLAATLVFGLLHLRAVEGVGIDVYFLHTGAADALASGLNPYTDAVEVMNGAPTAGPEDVIVGYLYPPTTAIGYSLGYWAFSDPRFTSLISWSIFLAILGVRAVRRKSTPGLLVMLLMASVPGWPLVLRAAWTEPFSLALLAVAYVLWRRPLASGTFAGLALSSKQYFFVTAPALLLHRDTGWKTRIFAVAGAIVLTVGAGLIWDPQAFWSAAIEFHLSTPPRPNSANFVGLASLLGLSWDPPGLLPILVGLLFAFVAGRSSKTPRSLVVAISLALAGSFLVGSQAFANYWFLVAGLCGLVLADRLTDVSTRDKGETDSVPDHDDSDSSTLDSSV